MAGTGSMSLEKNIAAVMRRRVPEHVFLHIPDQDRAFIENIICLAQQTVQELNVALTDIQKSNDTYLIRIPASGAETAVGIAQLRDIEAYSPFRILDVGVRCAFLAVYGAHTEVGRAARKYKKSSFVTTRREVFLVVRDQKARWEPARQGDDCGCHSLGRRARPYHSSS